MRPLHIFISITIIGIALIFLCNYFLPEEFKVAGGYLAGCVMANAQWYFMEMHKMKEKANVELAAIFASYNSDS